MRIKILLFALLSVLCAEENLSIKPVPNFQKDETKFISRQNTTSSSQILDVSVTTPQTSGLNRDTNASLDIEIPEQVGKIYDFITYVAYKNKIKFNTDDELISDFSIGNPSKIVLDFKSNFISSTKNIKLSHSVFRRIDFGSHKGYYRLVIYLDGKYNYTLQKNSSVYLIVLQ